MTTLALIGFASGVAANNADCALGPQYLYHHPELFTPLALTIEWQTMVQTASLLRGPAALPLIEKNLTELGQVVLPLAQRSEAFCVMGGDHSCAIGTWSAVAHAHRAQGDIGLIWIDAHMDSHTPDTSASQNIHGMPVAHLLGHGIKSLCQLFDSLPKIKPQHLCLIGIRSFEAGEATLLQQLGVKIFFMEEILARGIDVVLQEAKAHVLQGTCGYGISIDLDAIDPVDAPGVGCREPNGIQGAALVKALATNVQSQDFLGLEITEYNPVRDESAKTAQVIVNLIEALYSA